MTSLFNLAKPASLECEVSRVRAENQALIEELAQCQTDKDFVWSLWKRLQVTSPDITQAVSMVVQREKEKAELKDRKVLEILQLKDNKMDELNKLSASHQHEVNNLIALKFELQKDVNRLKLENCTLNDQCLSHTARRDETHSSYQTIHELNQLILDLKQKLSKQGHEVSGLLGDNVDLTSMKDTQKSRIRTLEDDLKTIEGKYDVLATEHMEAKVLLRKYEKQLASQKSELDSKAQELDTVRRELSEIWSSHSQSSDHATQQADVIRQLRNLQTDTQKMLKNQEEAFNMESKSLQTQLLEQEVLIAGYQQQLDQLGASTLNTRTSINTQRGFGESESGGAMNQRLHQLQTQLDSLRSQMSHSGTRTYKTCDRASSPVRYPSRGRSLDRSITHPRSFKGHKGRSKSEPRHRFDTDDNVTTLEGKFNVTDKMEETQNLLQLKNQELDEIRMVHKRRLERLQSLQSNYRLLKKQLKLAEDELNGPRRKRRKIPRADIRSLQREDSDGVWNELTFFKNENRNLLVERMNLMEELDILKVQAAHDTATIYELHSCLDQEREELQFLTEDQNGNPSPTPQLEIDLKKSKKKMKKYENEIKKLQSDNQMISVQQEKGLVERREMKSQINLLQQREADYRMKIADLNKELARVNREVRRRKKMKGKTTIAKQYQRVLNRSINQMTKVFDDFDDNGWEEISDTEDQAPSGEDGTSATGDSLGQAIADQASMTQPDSIPGHKRGRFHPRQVHSVKEHVERLRRRSESPNVPPAAHREHSPVRRDVALSPIHFLCAKTRVNRPRPVSRSRPLMTSVGTSPCVVSSLGSNTNGSNRQVATLKQRIQTLQHQVTLLKTTRDHTAQKNTEQKEQIVQLEADITSANQKLQSSRMTIQRLTSDLERIHGDKELMEQQLREHSFETNTTTHSDQEWNLLQSRLKTASIDASRQLTQIRQLKSDNASQKEIIQQLQDRLEQFITDTNERSVSRLNHMERDVAQKRTLLEDMRIKLRFAQENAQTDAQVMTEVENRLKNLSDTNSRYKTQTDSLKQRISAVTKEKHENEDKVLKLSMELERKTKQASEIQRKNSELQSTVVAIERTAQEQLHVLASQSEVAIDSAQTKLIQANTLLNEHDKFIKVFSHALLYSLQQARSLWQQQKQIKKAVVSTRADQLDPSMRRAQSLACDILNISQSDLEDIMSGKDGDSDKVQDAPEKSEDAKKDRKWFKKLEKTIQNKVEFAVPMTELFMEKIDERNKLSAKLQMT